MLLKKYKTGGKAKKYKVESFKEQPKMDVNVTPRFTLKQKKAIKKAGKKGAFLGSYYGSGILGQRFASSEESKKHSKKDVVKGGIFKGLVPKKGAKMLGKGLVGGAVGGYLGHKVGKKIGERRAKAKIEGKWYLGKKLGQLRKKVGLQTGGKVKKYLSLIPKTGRSKSAREIARKRGIPETSHDYRLRMIEEGKVSRRQDKAQDYRWGKATDTKMSNLRKKVKSGKLTKPSARGEANKYLKLKEKIRAGRGGREGEAFSPQPKKEFYQKGGKVLKKQSGREFRKGLEKAPDLDNDLWDKFISGGNMVLPELLKKQKARDAHGKATKRTKAIEKATGLKYPKAAGGSLDVLKK